MKISLSVNQFFDDKGFPLVSGRVSIYLHGSDTLADIYTMDGDEYVQATNPVILSEDGRMPTVFFDATIVDVKLEQRNLDNTYTMVDTFQDGFNIPAVKNDTVVMGIDGLKDANPELGIVTVYGYGDGIVAPSRFYVWDPTCTNSPDDGVIVASDSTDTGRWILLWDDEKLPCSIYGIVPGESEANISAFLGFPDNIGQWNIRTPKIARFLSGTYTSATTFTATRTLYFDRGAKFPSASFRCPGVIVQDNDDYVADFVFTGDNARAYSSWFKTSDAFWNSGAKFFRVEPVNHFADNRLSYEVELTNCVIEGSEMFTMVYLSGASLKLIGTKVPDAFFSASDFVTLGSLEYGDSMFKNGGNWDPGLITAGHHVLYSNAPDLDRFADADRWVAVMVERKSRMGSVFPTTILDLQGRSLANGISLNATNGFIGIRNATINGLVSAFGTTCTMYNVICELNVNSASGCSVVLENCRVDFTVAPVGLVQVVSTDSHITVAGNNGFDTADTALNIYGGTFQGFLSVSTPYTKSKNVIFNNVKLAGSTAWKLNRLYCHDCYGDVKIDLYPYSEDSTYWYELDFQGNTLVGSGRIWFTGVFTQAEPKTDMAGNVKFGICRILNNGFYGGTHGVKMLREHPYAFTHFMASTVGPWEYAGNQGDCPVVKPDRISNSTTFSLSHKTSGQDPEWIISDNTFNAWAPYQSVLSQGVPVQAQAGDGIEDSIAEVVDSVGSSSEPHNIVFGWSAGLPSPADPMDEDANNQFIEYLCLTWDLAVMTVPGGITRFP